MKKINQSFIISATDLWRDMTNEERTIFIIQCEELRSGISKGEEKKESEFSSNVSEAINLWQEMTDEEREIFFSACGALDNTQDIIKSCAENNEATINKLFELFIDSIKNHDFYNVSKVYMDELELRRWDVNMTYSANTPNDGVNSNHGKTSLDVAKESKNAKVIMLLLDNGARNVRGTNRELEECIDESIRQESCDPLEEYFNSTLDTRSSWVDYISMPNHQNNMQKL